MSIQLSYRLVGSGWAECTISIDGTAVTISASYLSDALDELGRAIADILRGEPSSTAAFDEEPGEYRWRFDHVANDRVRVRILDFPELWGHKPDEAGECIFEAECRIRTLAGELVSTMQGLLTEHGLEGYKEKWVEHDFPEKRLAQLQHLLADGSEPVGA